MPHVIVKLWTGKSEQHKIRLAEKITCAILFANKVRRLTAISNPQLPATPQRAKAN
jgi:phenylpyruvate tautomerase PptA (4-oxalocrotonate tautomerase family)